MAWIVNALVDVKIGTQWCPAVVKVVRPDGKYEVDLNDPLPTLASCGESHPYVPSSTTYNRRVLVNSTGNLFTTPTDLSTIRNRV